jgi:hypothetical protein
MRNVPGTEAHLSHEDLDALPEGTARAFTLAHGVVLTFEKEGRAWKVHTRPGVPATFLARFPSVERVRRGGGS